MAIFNSFSYVRQRVEDGVLKKFPIWFVIPRFIVGAAAGRITVKVYWFGFWAYPLVYKKQTGTSPS